MKTMSFRVLAQSLKSKGSNLDVFGPSSSGHGLPTIKTGQQGTGCIPSFSLKLPKSRENLSQISRELSAVFLIISIKNPSPPPLPPPTHQSTHTHTSYLLLPALPGIKTEPPGLPVSTSSSSSSKDAVANGNGSGFPHPLYINKCCKWPNCEAHIEEFSQFIK